MTLTFLRANKKIIIKNVIYLQKTKKYYIFQISKDEKIYYIKKYDALLIKISNYTKFLKQGEKI